MPTFDTPEPITVTVEVGVGDIKLEASERTETVVRVCPSDPAKKDDVDAAEQTRVHYAGGRLQIRAPKGWRRYTPLGGRESIDVKISLPVGSHVRGEAGIAAFRGTGRLGDCRLKTGLGEIRLDRAGLAVLRTGAGDITVDQVADRAEIVTGTGALEVGSIGGTAVLKNSNGDTWVGEVTGELRVNAANGKISVDLARAAVTAKTANGDICLSEVSRGAVRAQTALGKIDIGVLDGVAAWLDLHTRYGSVRNDLEAAEPSEPGEASVEVAARTSFGDITIRRSSPLADNGRDET